MKEGVDVEEALVVCNINDRFIRRGQVLPPLDHHIVEQRGADLGPDVVDKVLGEPLVLIEREDEGGHG